MHAPEHGRYLRQPRLQAAALFLLVACTASALAQSRSDTPNAAGIYTCTDARGRTQTADRPIPECNDREQRELNPSGTTRRKIEPTYTAKEQADRDDRAREAAAVAARQLDERRRERALLMRYPNAASHDRERAESLVQVDAVIQAARKRLDELADEKKKIDDELEFYKSDPSKAPGALRRRIEDNVQSVAVQNRFIGEQMDEKKRLNARFDDERAKLKLLWSPANGGTASSK